ISMRLRELRLRVDVRDAFVQLEVSPPRAQCDGEVVDRMQVVQEARPRDAVSRGETAAWLETAFEQQHAEARAGEVVGEDEAVVARSDHNAIELSRDIVFARHSC